MNESNFVLSFKYILNLYDHGDADINQGIYMAHCDIYIILMPKWLKQFIWWFKPSTTPSSLKYSIFLKGGSRKSQEKDNAKSLYSPYSRNSRYMTDEFSNLSILLNIILIRKL